MTETASTAASTAAPTPPVYATEAELRAGLVAQLTAVRATIAANKGLFLMQLPADLDALDQSCRVKIKALPAPTPASPPASA